jgi:cytidylate kinase
MPIISMSRLSCTSSAAIADGLAARLELSRIEDEIFADAAGTSGIEIDTIRKAFSDAPSLFGMNAASRKRCIVHVQAALATRFLADDVVYLGGFGHLLVQGVSHLLKVRITATRPDRIALKAEREGCDEKQAAKRIDRDDKQRKNLAQQVFQVDDDDDDPFDLVINTSQVDVPTAVDIVAETVRHDRYRPMTYSMTCMRNVEVAHRVKAALVDLDTDVDAQAENGTVRVRIRGGGKANRVEEVRTRALALDGVETVEVLAIQDLLDGKAGKLI